MKSSVVLLQFFLCAGLMAAKTHQDSQSCNLQPTASDLTPCFMRGDQPLASSLITGNTQTAAYGYPANIRVNGGWDVYGEVSYLLWYTKQEGLDLAASGYYYGDELWEPANVDGTVVFQDAKYSSGFKIGVGANLNVDDWVVDLVYTYLRQETLTHSGDISSSVSSGGLPPFFNMSGWFQSNYYGGQDIAQNFTSKWKMHLDWLDLQFSRPFYEGTRFVATPSAGLRASWIRQQLHISSPNLQGAYYYTTPVDSVSANYSGSWAIGPRALIDMRWLVGQGFRFEANMGGSLLFTQFTHVSHRESDLVSGGVGSGGVQVGFRNYNCLRPMAEASLGIGWGRYLDCKKYHLDLSATYDFNYLWSQNMMRYLVASSSAYISGATAGDMILHGLDIKARFDF